MAVRELDVTELMLRLCYTCDDVNRCDTEEKCIACFSSFVDQDEEDIDLRESFRLYAL